MQRLSSATFLLLLLLLSCSTSAIITPEKHTYIILVDGNLKPSIFPSHHHWYTTTLSSTNTSATPIHTYGNLLHGFAAHLTPSHADHLLTFPGFLVAIPELVRYPDTTRTPEFLGLRSTRHRHSSLFSDLHSSLSGIVLAVVDTGIFPFHRSFHDRGLGPIPPTWKGTCVSGDGFDPATACNRKLVGARFFSAGYETAIGKMNETAELRSPLDTDGHGTHTASIAAGRRVSRATALGYARGAASGMAPHARLAAYKACWLAGCFDSDILAAFDAAVADGADVVSLSVGGAVVPYYLDAIAVGAFAAAEAGVFVATSAGNGGPGGLTVTNVAPWVTTVGAGSVDRDFPAVVRLGNGRSVSGVSVYGGPSLTPGRLFPLVYADNAGGDGYSSALCLDKSLDPATVRGKIVLCDRGVNKRAEKGEVVRKAGGVGMILANGVFDGEGLVADCHVIPAAAVGANAGEIIRKYISRSGPTKPATATIEFLGTRLGVSPAPLVAAFSARGPNPHTPDLLKPDLIAPGLNILGAWPENIGPSGVSMDFRRTEFNILSGTSMACPHVAGLAALIRAAHPNWSPSAIRSALMTTAYNRGTNNAIVIDESTKNSSATALDFGAGHVDPRRALDPGLVYDAGPIDYIYFMCNLNYTTTNIKVVTRRKTIDCRDARRVLGHAGNLNYPSLAAEMVVSERRVSAHFIRVLTNVGPDEVIEYKVEVVAPEGCEVEVEPSRLFFRRVGQKRNFLVRVLAHGGVKLSPGGSMVRSGKLSWMDGKGKYIVSSPIVVTLQAPL